MSDEEKAEQIIAIQYYDRSILTRGLVPEDTILSVRHKAEAYAGTYKGVSLSSEGKGYLSLKIIRRDTGLIDFVNLQGETKSRAHQGELEIILVLNDVKLEIVGSLKELRAKRQIDKSVELLVGNF